MGTFLGTGSLADEDRAGALAGAALPMRAKDETVTMVVKRILNGKLSMKSRKERLLYYKKLGLY